VTSEKILIKINREIKNQIRTTIYRFIEIKCSAVIKPVVTLAVPVVHRNYIIALSGCIFSAIGTVCIVPAPRRSQIIRRRNNQFSFAKSGGFYRQFVNAVFGSVI